MIQERFIPAKEARSENVKPEKIAEGIYYYGDKDKVEINNNGWRATFRLAEGKLILVSQENFGGDAEKYKLPEKGISLLKEKTIKALTARGNIAGFIVTDKMIAGAYRKRDIAALRNFGKKFSDLSEDELEASDASL